MHEQCVTNVINRRVFRVGYEGASNQETSQTEQAAIECATGRAHPRDDKLQMKKKKKTKKQKTIARRER